MMNVQKKRIEWIDIAKGITIFLMVFGHCEIPSQLKSFIWSFHMPLFFIISGFLFTIKKYSTFYFFFKRRIKTLLIPYILLSTIVITLLVVNKDYLASSWSLSRGWVSYPLWFIQVLFTVEILMYFTIKYITNKIYFLITIIGFLFLGYLLEINEISLPYCQSSVFWASFFYGMGYFFKNFIKRIKLNLVVPLLMLLFSYFSAAYLPQIDMRENMYGNIFITNFFALWGTLAIILIAKEISTVTTYIKSIFIWAGKNTMLILGLASIIIHILVNVFNYSGLEGILRHFIMWTIIYILSVVINTYVPFLVGKSNNH